MSNVLENELQDKLIIELFDLIEQSVTSKMNFEKTMNTGQLLLAKSRYIQGSQSVSTTKLPTENSTEFNALKTVTHTPQTNSQLSEIQLNAEKIDKEKSFIDPLRWFGVLVPRSLQLAQERFNNAIEIAIECTNIQLKLQKTIENLLLLRSK